MTPKEDNNWSSYERLVLAELERLDSNQKALHEKLDKVVAIKESVDELKKKQEKTDTEVGELKTFKTQVKTIGVLIQLLIATIVSFITGKITGQ